MTVTYTVIFSKLAQEKFDRFIHADRRLGEQLAKAIDRLAHNPTLGEFLKGDDKDYRKYRTDSRIVSTEEAPPSAPP